MTSPSGRADDEVFRQHVRWALEGPADDFALVRVEFDRIDRIAEYFGDAVAEFVRDELAHRLRDLAADPLAAFSPPGGAALVLVRVDGDDADALSRAAWDVMRHLTSSVDVGVDRVSVGCSVGIAHPSVLTDRSVASLVNAATDASGRAAARGSRRIAVFEGTHQLTGRRGELDRSLYPALATDQIVAWYQPRVRLADGVIVGAEALVRWQHPLLGLVSATEFVPEARISGLIRQLDAIVLGQAAREAATWPAAVGVSVNLSTASLENPDVAREVVAVLDASGLAADRVTLEVAETAAQDDLSGHVRRLAALKELGVRLSLDDWGAGYAFVDVLGEGLFDEIKIDRPLVRGWEGAPNDEALRALVEMATGIGLDVVAEGIQTAEELDRVRASGCPVGQGDLLHPAMPRQALRDLLLSA